MKCCIMCVCPKLPTQSPQRHLESRGTKFPKRIGTLCPVRKVFNFADYGSTPEHNCKNFTNTKNEIFRGEARSSQGEIPIHWDRYSERRNACPDPRGSSQGEISKGSVDPDPSGPKLASILYKTMTETNKRDLLQRMEEWRTHHSKMQSKKVMSLMRWMIRPLPWKAES
jgi:hypothetical protein